MIPIRDDIPSRGLPVVNYAIIALNVFVFLQQLQAGKHGDAMVERYGMIPARITYPNETIAEQRVRLVRDAYGRPHRVAVEHEIANPRFHPWWTVVTCIVLHGGWMHLIGNCWFLYIFGDNVEDRLGHLVYLGFYLLSGVGASVIHWATDPHSLVPTIGASGAIAGVMGAYFLLYPRARVLSLVPIFIFLQIIELPAYLFLGVWLVIQFLQGTAAITQHAGGGVAWWAHIGGFLVGGVVLVALRIAGLIRKAPTYSPSQRFASAYRYHRH